jgi:hypothetical protein
MAVKVSVKGINILLSGLDQYSKEIQSQVEKEIQDWGERTVNAAKRDVAIDTGALKNTIRSVVSSDKLSQIVKAGNNTDVKYAAYIEFGTGSFVDQSFLQQYGLVQYASQFRGKGERQVNLPMRTFLYANARTEFEKTFQNIKKILESSWK